MLCTDTLEVLVMIVNILLHMYLQDYIAGYEKIWFFGDNFAFNTFAKYYQQVPLDRYDGYIRNHYEVTGFMNSKYASQQRSMLARMRNLLPNAISNQPLLPKMVVIVPDDDLIRFMRHRKCGISNLNFQRVINWLMNEYERTLLAYKEKLHSKLKKVYYPYFIWIEAPLHSEFDNNRDREIFNAALKEVSLLHEDVAVLELKKIWTYDNRNLYLANSDRFTVQGLHTYWEAVDRTVKYADTTILKKAALKILGPKRGQGVDKYKWFAPAKNSSRIVDNSKN